MSFNIESIDELLSTTRAVRKRLDLDRPVPRDVILDCLRLAVQAPTGANSQLWRWVVVDDVAQRAALAALYRSAGREELARSAAVAAQDGQKQTERVYNSAVWLADNLENVPVHVVACVEGNLPSEAHAAHLAGYYGSVFPAIWSFQLALRARGLGSTLTTLHLFKEEEAARILKLPKNVAQVALLPVAYTKGIDFKPADRLAVSSITHWNSW